MAAFLRSWTSPTRATGRAAAAGSPCPGRSCRPSRHRARALARCRGGRRGRTRRPPCRAAGKGHRSEVRHGGPCWAGCVDLGRAAGVAVVEANDVEATVGQLPAQPELPVDEVHAQAHNEEKRRIGGGPERLVGDLELAHARSVSAANLADGAAPISDPGEAGAGIRPRVRESIDAMHDALLYFHFAEPTGHPRPPARPKPRRRRRRRGQPAAAPQPSAF
jgi:hypothetical protein